MTYEWYSIQHSARKWSLTLTCLQNHWIKWSSCQKIHLTKEITRFGKGVSVLRNAIHIIISGLLWNLLNLLKTENNEWQINESHQIDFQHKLRKSLGIYRSCKPNQCLLETSYVEHRWGLSVGLWDKSKSPFITLCKVNSSLVSGSDLRLCFPWLCIMLYPPFLHSCLRYVTGSRDLETQPPFLPTSRAAFLGPHLHTSLLLWFRKTCGKDT